ncbi:hypothetical protein MUK42_24285 [Musa troglodytarum]|uniref:Uncharacterized protein n=1 Tax=Musa troglodytarum TaxID=320322 RepID=A0A9E7KWT8_9LILI|nr:hypothetical protein MUK42_24285 [Musa troglodytarum]
MPALCASLLPTFSTITTTTHLQPRPRRMPSLPSSTSSFLPARCSCAPQASSMLSLPPFASSLPSSPNTPLQPFTASSPSKCTAPSSSQISPQHCHQRVD